MAHKHQIAFLQSFHILLALMWLSLFHKTVNCSQCAFTDLVSASDLDLSNDQRNRSVDNNSSSADDYCVTSQPSSADIGHLCQREYCDVIQCVHSTLNKSSAHTLHTSFTVCFSKVCNMFSISTRGTKSDEQNLLFSRANLRDLEKTIDSLLIKSPDVTEVKERIDLKCVDIHSTLVGQNLKVQVSNLSEATLSDVNNSENLTKSKGNYEKSINIHLFYFRFVSRWESYIKFPKWHATMEVAQQRSDWGVFTSDNIQSTSLVLENNLRSLLDRTVRNASNENMIDANLIDLAIKHGNCVRFNFIGCHRPSDNHNLQKLIMSAENLYNCDGSVSRYYTEDALNVTSCEKDKNDFSLGQNMEMRLLLNDVFTRKKWNIFSISLINVPDLHSTHDLDRELTDLTFSLLHRHDHISILMSDVGDPQFSRLDASIFLRQQTFNPFLFTLSPKDLNMSFLKPDSAQREPDRNSHVLNLVVLSDIFHFLKSVIMSNTNVELNNNSTIDIDDKTNSSSLTSNILRGPVECICEGNQVHFPNDSIQSAFASFAVGSINNYFYDLSFVNKNNDISCGRLIGVKFDNVRHVLFGNSTYISTTVLLTSESYSKTTRRILRLDTHLRYTTDNGMNFSLYITTNGKYHQTFPLNHEKTTRLQQKFCGRKTLLETYTDSSSSFPYGHFGVEAKVKPLPVSCLLLMTTKFADSTILEVSSHCEQTAYELTLSAELIDTISLARLPVKITVRPNEVRYISSLVKAYYGATSSAYKLSFKITAIVD